MEYKPNVLIVTYEVGKKVSGGVGRVINHLVTNLEGKISFDINHLEWSRSESCWHSNIIRIKGNKYNSILKGEYISVLLRAIAQEKYNIIHFLHIGENNTNCAIAIKANFPEVKIVYSCHSIAKFEYGIRNNRKIEVEFEKKLLHNINHLHLLNDVSLKYFQACYPEIIVSTRYTFIPNGISADEFEKTNWFFKKKLLRKLKEDDICVICISRWAYGKGIEFLVDAVPEVLKKRKNVKFIIAGRKEKSWENNIDKYVSFIDSKIHPYQNNIIKLGWLNNTERNTLFSIADICIMPSLVEYLPYSILEPMMAKVPIISSRIDSVEFLLNDNKECLYFNPEDSKDLASKILDLIDNIEDRKTMINNAYNKAVLLYNWEHITKLYIDMYKSILDPVYSTV